MGEVADKAQHAGQQAHHSEWLDHAIRAGLVAYGIVHLMVAWLAAQLALGDKSENASNSGALHALAEQPMGGVLIWMIAVGMLLLVVWRLLEFAMGYQDETDDAKRWRKRATSLGKASCTASWPGARSRSRWARGPAAARTPPPPSSWTCPAGSSSWARSGSRSSATAAYLVYRGWTEKFTEHLDAQGQSGKDGSAYVLFGKVGYIAKGISIAIVGGLFGYAAITHDAKKSGGLDQALQTVLEQPFGQLLLIAIAIGIACYGLFCFARAKHLSR